MTKRRTGRRARQHGFTLLETLIATALMVAVLGALATVTAQWLPNWNRGFHRVQRTELFALGLERLVADIAAAEFVAPNRTTKSPLFEGDELSLTFVRTAVGPNSRPGLEVVRVAETSDARGFAMVRMRGPFAPIATDARIEDQIRLADPVVLVRAPYRVSYAYAGEDRVWRDRWSGADNKLPSAVKLTVRDAGSEDILAVSTVATIHAQVPAECVAAGSGGPLPSAPVVARTSSPAAPAAAPNAGTASPNPAPAAARIDCGEARPRPANPAGRNAGAAPQADPVIGSQGGGPAR